MTVTRGLPRLRCTVVGTTADADAAGRWLIELVDGTTRLDVDVVLPSAGPLSAELQALGVPVSLAPRPAGPFGAAKAAFELARRFVRSPAEVVLVDGAQHALVAASLAGIPAVWVERAPRLNGFASWTSRLADEVVPAAQGSRHEVFVETYDPVVGALARVAGRPGAGLSPSGAITVLTSMKNEAGFVDGVLGAVAPQLHPDDEYIIVNDGSTDRTGEEIAAWARNDPRIRVVEGPGKGISAARNAGVRAARRGVVACTDAGCQPVPHWLDALRGNFSETNPADLVVGVYRVPARGPLQQAFAMSAFPDVAEARRATPLVRLYSRFFGRAFSSRRLDTRSMAVTVDAWRRAGGFNERLHAAEDAVFGHAVLAAGGRSVLALDAEVLWEQAPTIQATARMYFRYGLWAARGGDWPLVRRDLARALAYVLAPLAVVRGGAHGASVVAAGGGAYLSLPLSRALRHRIEARAVCALPLALAIKDLAKAVGCLRGLLDRRMRPLGAAET